MPTPTTRSSVFAALVLVALTMLGAGNAAAQCTQGQMTEAQLQFGGAQQLLQAKQWDQAVGQLQSIVEFCPEFFPALRGLGLAYQNTGQLDLAADAFSKAIAVQNGQAGAVDYANLAKVLTMQKKYKEARAEYLKAQKLDAENCFVLVNLGILHNASGFPTQAVDALEDAMMFCPDLQPQILPRLAEACTKAADQQKKIGNPEKAEMYLVKAREYGGSAGGTTAYKQIETQMKQGDYAGTIELCDQLLAKQPDHANALLTKARAADALGRKPVSIEAYQEYLALRPDNMHETANMIVVMSEAGQCNQAIAAAKEAMTRFAGTGAKELGKINFAYGKALFCAEDYASAKAQFQRAASSGDTKWAPYARDGITACDEYLDFADRKARAEAQQGR